MLADVESADFMQINDLDLDLDLVVTGGKDCKVKVWMISSLLK